MLVSVLILPIGLCFCACNGGGNGGDDDTAYGGPQCTVGKTEIFAKRFCGLSESSVFALSSGILNKFDGSTWSQVEVEGEEAAMKGIWCSSESNVFIVGFTGGGQVETMIRHYDGQTWSDMAHPDGYERMLSVWGASPNDVFAIAEGPDGNAVLHYDGQAWTEMHTGIDSFEKIWGTSGSDVYAFSKDAGDGNLERMYHYNGEIWSEFTLPVSSLGAIDDVWGTDPDNLYFVGTTSGSPGYPVIIHKNGANWTPTVFEYWYDELTDEAPNCGFGAVWGYGDDSIFAFGCKDYYFDGEQWWDITNYLHEKEFSGGGGGAWGTSLQNTFTAGVFVNILSCQ